MEAQRERIRELEEQLAQQAAETTSAKANIDALQAQVDAFRTVPSAQAMATAFAEALAANRGAGGERQHRKVGGSMPTFTGKANESYSYFESRFKCWATYNNLSDEDKKMQLYQALQGSAGEIVNIFGPESEAFWSSFADYAVGIRALFETRAQSEAAKTAFEMTHQEKDELIQQYAARKLAKFQLAYPTETWSTSEYLMRLFIKDLRNEKVREQIVLKGAEAGATYHTMVQTAANFEASFELLGSLEKGKPGRATVQVTPQVAKEEPMELGAMIAAMQTLMKGSADPAAVLAALQRPKRDEQGRFLRQRGRGRGGQQSNREGCWTCGENGHFARECNKNPGGGWNSGGRGRGYGGRGNNGRGRGGVRGGRGYNAMGAGESSGVGQQQEEAGQGQQPGAGQQQEAGGQAAGQQAPRGF